MVYVVMRDGRVLQYNTANRYNWESNYIDLSDTRGNGSVARITSWLVERIEFKKPCKITKLRTKSSREY